MPRIEIGEVRYFVGQFLRESERLRDALGDYRKAVAKLVADGEIQGAFVDSAKSYYETVHYPIVDTTIECLSEADRILKKYVQDFESQVDDAFDSRLDSDKLDALYAEIRRSENLLDDFTYAMDSMTGNLNIGQQIGMKLGLETSMMQIKEEIKILERYLDFEHSHTNVMHDVLSRMYQVKTGVNEILAGKAFNGTTHTYDFSKMQLGWLNRLVPEKKPKKTYNFDDYTKTLEGSYWILSKNGITNRETAEASIAYNDGLKDGTIKVGNGDPDIDFDTANMLAAMDGYNLLTGEEITKAQSLSIISAVLLGGIAMKGRGMKIPKSNLAKIQKELEIRDFSNTSKNAKEIISERVNGLDLREHPTQIKQLSSKKMQELRQKVDNRTITKQEYVEYNWNKKFAKKRKAGVTEFWDMEADRITNGEFTTRNWSDNQMEDILMGKVPKFDGKSIAGHHSFSASKYPHLADKGEIIYPATFNEHLYGWHGGNWKNSLPGEPIMIIKDF